VSPNLVFPSLVALDRPARASLKHHQRRNDPFLHRGDHSNRRVPRISDYVWLDSPRENGVQIRIMLLTIHLIEGLILDSWRQFVSQQCRRCHDHFGVTVRVGVANGGIEFCIVLHQPVQAERRNVDIDPHKTMHDVLEFAFAEIAALQTLRQCAAINSQSRARQAIRLVEISSFVENAPLKIEAIHFASVTYVWHSPCISRYRRNVDSQIQQPI
jgi:hypothetical protein